MSGVGNGLLARAGRLTLALGLGAGVGLPASAQEAAPRPRVGLALGGGSARGIAHVGVLEWLEEHRIPVDAIAGTSMGGLIGGAYATGMSARQIQELLRDADWDLIFKADAPYRLKGYRRKEDAREFPVKLEMGLRRGGATPASCSTSRRSSGFTSNGCGVVHAFRWEAGDFCDPFGLCQGWLHQTEPRRGSGPTVLTKGLPRRVESQNE